MINQETQEHSIDVFAQADVDARAEADQEKVWQEVFAFVDAGIDAIYDESTLETPVETLQKQLRQLVIDAYQKGHSLPESRSVHTNELITYVATAFEYNEVMFSNEGVTNILQAAEVL